ncbi:MAG: amidohydrolase [Bacteroidetes bacterium]|nr:amidohydrolase [Bacteroidota bacterium]MBK9480787.1 amidohydrolase [Bacteroidota bacterium]
MNTTLTFTLLQSHLHWEDKEANMKMFAEKLQQLEGKHEIVVLPEMFTTGFSMNPSALAEPMNGTTIQWMTQLAARHKIILTGSIMIAEVEHYYNRLIWMQPNGEYGYYDKRHLFSYGGEDKAFSPGDKKLIAQVKGWKICTQICYDLRFPVWSRQHKENPYDVLLYVANWPEKRIHAWKTLLQARAIENQCYVVAVNRIGVDGKGLHYNGESCVVNPLGEVQYCPLNEDGQLTVSLDKNELNAIRDQFPFLKDADDFVIL